MRRLKMTLIVLSFAAVAWTGCVGKESGKNEAQPDQIQPHKPLKMADAAVPVQAKESAGSINWLFSLDEGLKAATTSGKPVMIDFYADWCGWCKKLDKDVYTDPEVIKAAKNFVAVKVNSDVNQKDAQKYGVTGLPTIVFLKPNGDIAQTIVGYRPSQEFLKVMNEVLAGLK